VKLSIWKYVKVNGKWRYCKPATTPNNKIKPHVMLVAGQEEKHPEGNYYILDSGQWIKAGPNPADATALAKRRMLMREGVKMGIIEAPIKQTKTDLNELIDGYLTEISATKKKKTYQAYKVALGYFQQSLAARARTLPLTRDDMISFKVYLRDEEELDDRTVSNKWTDVCTFLNAYGLKPELKKGDTPTYVEEEPEIYTEEEIERFFAACTPEEDLLFAFFRQTACREQEVIFMTNRSLDFQNCVVTIKQNDEHGWTPKAYRGRSIPVSRDLGSGRSQCLIVPGSSQSSYRSYRTQTPQIPPSGFRV